MSTASAKDPRAQSRSCQSCGESIDPSARKGARYCSAICRSRHWRDRQRQERITEPARTTRQCPACLRDIAPQSSGRADQVYCGPACRTRAWRARTGKTPLQSPAASARSRGLPFRPRPFPEETLSSYLQRIATANHLSLRVLLTQLQGTRALAATTIDIARLASAVDLPEPTLRGALPELRDAGAEVALDRRGLAPDFAGKSIRPACRRCVAGRGVLGAVDCWRDFSHNVCLTHQLWIGYRIATSAEQFDVSGLPEISRAQRRERALIGRPGGSSALSEATAICYEWTTRGIHAQRYEDRLRILAPTGQLSAAIFKAAAYPEIIAMGLLLSTPHWRALARSTRPQARDRIILEVGRRTGQPYQPAPWKDPVLRWVREQQPLTHHPSEQQHPTP
ncbi:TniQ family protein [Nonomuraea angiospora]|uniref:TniQ family protein n=1 Tax=Nonomuraea angiospora TaxID=46172 RepID=UPI00343550C6